MQIIINIIIFLLTLFFYIHINFHLTTNNDLEILEVDEINKQKFEEVCDYKKPLLFKFYNEEIDNCLNIDNIINNYPNFEINIRNTNDYNNKDTTLLPMKIKDSIELFNKDLSNTYISEYNNDFLEESTLIKSITSNDLFLRPYLCSEYKHDIILGSLGTYVPLRYELNYRSYLYVIDGEIDVMLTVPSNEKYLDIIKDYDLFEFRSGLSPFQENNDKLDKVKFLSVTLKKGDMLYIPFKWFYTYKIKMSNSIVCFSKYKVIMNSLAIFPEIINNFIYKQNLKLKFMNTIS